jgi:hypothetical protein
VVGAIPQLYQKEVDTLFEEESRNWRQVRGHYRGFVSFDSCSQQVPGVQEAGG